MNFNIYSYLIATYTLYLYFIFKYYEASAYAFGINGSAL